MMTEIKENFEEQAALFTRDEEAAEAIDISALITLIITIMIGAIVLGALLPTFSEQVTSLKNATESAGISGMGEMVELIPMLVVLIFVISIIVVLVGQIKKGL